MRIETHLPPLSRRGFLQNGSFWMLGAGLSLSGTRSAAGALENRGAKNEKAEPSLKIGLVTDVHYADKEMAVNRYYRESLPKLREAVAVLRERRVDFAVETGDLIDGARDDAAFLKTIDAVWKEAAPQRHYVLGNHCTSRLSKTEFLGIVEQPRSFYAFDHSGFHFVVLDACFRQDGTSYERGNFQWTDTDIPLAQREWLHADLSTTRFPTIVFIHQRLDLPPDSAYAVKSSPALRAVFEASGKVLCVFQGHSHKNEYAHINGIHYCTLQAMVEGTGEESSGYSILNIFADKTLQLEGFRAHTKHPWIAQTQKA